VWAGGSLNSKRGAFIADHGAPNRIAQLPDIARPGVLLQGIHTVLGNPIDTPPHPVGECFHKLPRQCRNVFHAFSQWWNGDREDVKAIMEIRTKLLLRDHFFQVAVGGCHDPDVHVNCPPSAESLDFTFLEDPQELDLGLKRESRQ
jgi:hypothetical protein